MLNTHSRLARVKFHPLLLEAYPHADINSSGPTRRLVWSAADTQPQRTRHLQRLVWADLGVAGRPRLVAENWAFSFRMGFLRALFPDARFIHMIRHGGEVARDIEQRCQAGHFWVRRPSVWQLTEALAAQSERTARLLPLCNSHYTRALFIWRLTVEAARAAATLLAPEHYYEVRYEDLVANPARVCEQVAAFVGEDAQAAMLAYAAEMAANRALPAGPYPAVPAALARDLLNELGYA
jgi:hypothetical protein